MTLRGWKKAACAAAVGASALAFSASASAEPVRILVAVGHKVGLEEEHALKYADADAARVRDVLVGYGGVRRENAYVLAEPTRAQLYAAVDRARDEAKKHRAEDVTLVFYFSGHGDHDAIHLGGDRVTLADLGQKLAEVPAALRIAVTDACRTTREKGFVADEPFAISTTTSNEATGQVWLHASSDGEAAQESDELRGAIFTHAWLNGLRGAADANGDARVTLEESFAFANSQTLIRSAKSSGVIQKPEAIVNLHELAPVVLTQTGANMATMSLPAGKDTHFLVYAAGAKSVVAELWGSPARRTALAIPPGRYVVQRRRGSLGGVAQLAMAAGEERDVDDHDFTASSLEALASKGAGGGGADTTTDADEAAPSAPPPRVRHHELTASYDAGADTRTGLVHGPRVGYAYAWKNVAVGIGGGVDLSGRTLPDTTEHLVTGFGRAGIEARVPFSSAVGLRAGVGGRAGYLSQTLEPNATGAARSSNGAFVAGPDAVLTLRVGLGPAVFADVGATGNVLFLKEAGKEKAVPGAAGDASLGAKF